MNKDLITTTIFSAMKAQAWEEAKGKLRSLVVMQGSIHGPSDRQSEYYEKLDELVETFIKEIETDSNRLC
jgi:hypothetical protein